MVSRRASRELPAQEPGDGTKNPWTVVGGVYPGGGPGDAGCGAPRSSAGLGVAGAGVSTQRPKGARAARKRRGWGRLRPPCPPVASQLRAGEVVGVGAPGSGRSAFPPAASCRATLVSPGPSPSAAFSSVTGG